MRILVADDHLVVRRGLIHIILEEFPNAEIGEVANAEDLIKLAIKETWDVIICDISMPGRSGLDVLYQLKELFPKLPVLIMSMHSEDQYAVRVLKAGAAGYITKDTAANHLVKAVRLAVQGKRYISENTADKLASSVASNRQTLEHEQLSDREFDVFKLIAAGKSLNDIAEQLSLSVTTISTYRSRILQKMKLKTNADLTIYAVKHQLIQY